MSPIFIAAEVAAECRRTATECDIAEHGGVLVVTPEHGDIVAYIEGPKTMARAATWVTIRAPELERDFAARVVEHPGALVGFFHVHLEAPLALSSLDEETLARLRTNPCFGMLGVIALLGVRRKGRTPLLRAWQMSPGGVLAERELHEVSDPLAARASETRRRGRAFAPYGTSLATTAGARRLVDEVERIESAGHAVEVTGTERGVVVRVAAGGFKGALRLTVSTEGWERPPKVELETSSGTELLFKKAPLWAFLASWTAAYSLADLIAFLIETRVWPKGHALAAAS